MHWLRFSRQGRSGFGIVDVVIDGVGKLSNQYA